MVAVQGLEPRRDPVAAVVEAFRSVTEEVDLELEPLQGRVPDGLRGTLFRNGVGKVEVEGIRQMHPFDGDGMISRFRIHEGGVRYRNRYVRTREYLEEKRAGTMRYRAFGTNLPGGLTKNLLRLRFKNAANTSVVWHGERLLALWEGGLPHALDSESLATLGRFDFGSTLRNPLLVRLLSPEPPFSAHPKVCPRTGWLYNFGLLAAPSPVLHLYRSPPSGDTVFTERYPLTRPSFMHDFALTERYAVFFATPVEFDVARTLAGLSAPVESLRRDPNAATEILVVPRNGGPARSLKTEAGFFTFHFFGAYEDDHRIFVHGCRMADFRGGTVDLADSESVRRATFDPAIPTRWTLDLDAGTVEEAVFDAHPMELPTIDPRRTTLRHRFGWGTLGRPHGPPIFHTGIGRIDLDTREVLALDLEADLPGEPLFVPRAPGAPEGDGWLLSVVYRADTQKSELWILDATSLEARARFGLPHHQPPGFHGCFVPS